MSVEAGQAGPELFPFYGMFALVLAIVVGVFVFRRLGFALISRRPDNADFWQAGASGRNLSNFITQVGGARGVLIVLVADGRLKTDLTFPLNLFPFNGVYGVCIDIEANAITAVERQKAIFGGERTTIRWGQGNGFEFLVRDPDALIRALDISGRIPVTDLR